MLLRRRPLKFADPDAVTAEVRRLRAGYERAGNWSLEQTCWHLNKAMYYSMQPGPHDPARVGLVRRLQLKVILAMELIPRGRQAPQRVLPPDQPEESVIDEFLITLQALKTFPGPFAPHRMFGKMDDKKFFRFHMIHCAHHFGFLAPAGRN